MVFSCSFAFDAFDSVRLRIYVAWIEKKDPLYLLMISREGEVIRQELEQEVEHYYTMFCGCFGFLVGKLSKAFCFFVLKNFFAFDRIGSTLLLHLHSHSTAF